MPDTTEQHSPLIVLRLAEVWRTDWWLTLTLAGICFIAASIGWSGWPAGLVPDLSYPYAYSWDAFSHLEMIQRTLEGSWYFQNHRLGFPFGSVMLDYPGSDAGGFAVFKLFGLLGADSAGAFNLFFLVGFSVVAATGYLVLRTIGIGRTLAAAFAIVYDVLPFHFLRIGHLLYTWYFVVPLYFYLALRIADAPRNPGGRAFDWKSTLLQFGALLALSCFGVYYAAFGVLVFGIAALVGAVRTGTFRPLIRGVASMVAVTVGVGLNVLPTVLYQRAHGPNLEVAHREPGESEYYGLKFTQLVLPRPDHRFAPFRTLAETYKQQFPLVNENSDASLGLLGSLGLLLGIGAVFRAALGRTPQRVVVALGLLSLGLFWFTTIGGVASIFALMISPMIRSWNRISVFIGFASLATLAYVLDDALRRRLTGTVRTGAVALTACVAIGFATWDQTTAPCLSCNAEVQASFKSDREFVQTIERSLPAEAAIFQLPYMAFPEVPTLHDLTAYGLARGFLHSQKLRWSWGGMRGRRGDRFFRELSEQPVAQQVAVVSRLGFAGIYIDRRGYADSAAALEGELRTLLGVGPSVISKDQQLSFFALPITGNSPSLSSPEELLRHADALPEGAGDRLPSTRQPKIDTHR